MAVSSALPKVLYSGQLTDTTEDVLYTAPTPGSAVLKHGTACNISAGVVNLSLSILRSGQTLGTGAHRVINGYQLAAGDTLSLADFIAGCCLGPGDFIAAQGSVANALDIVISGVEST